MIKASGWGVAVAAAVLMLGCGKGQDAPKGPSKPLEASATPLDAAQGRQLYNRVCASCHGMGGKGDGHRAGMLGPLPDFTDAGFHTQRTDAQLIEVMKAGKGRMPGFRIRYGEHEFNALVAVVRGFGPEATP